MLRENQNASPTDKTSNYHQLKTNHAGTRLCKELELTKLPVIVLFRYERNTLSLLQQCYLSMQGNDHRTNGLHLNLKSPNVPVVRIIGRSCPAPEP